MSHFLYELTDSNNFLTSAVNLHEKFGLDGRKSIKILLSFGGSASEFLQCDLGFGEGNRTKREIKKHKYFLETF